MSGREQSVMRRRFNAALGKVSRGKFSLAIERGAKGLACAAVGRANPALASLGDPRARELESRVSQLLEASFRSGRFAQI